jgi:NAD-dependent deacetylase
LCLGCAQRYDIAWVREQFDARAGRAPDCACGSPIKTATVSFGQPMPADAMQHAERLVRQCDLFLAIGSSLVVWPAAGFPLMAKRHGTVLVIVNREPTELDDDADLVVRDDIGDVFAPFISA